jgi:N-acetylmuramoyl-L-alanine amidase
MSTLKIAIGAGHGAPDPGCINNHIIEKDYTLAFATYLKARLDHSCEPIETKLTRTEDRNLSAVQEARMTLEWGSELFLALHINSFSDPNAHGLLCFHKRGSQLSHEVGNAILRAAPLPLMRRYNQQSILAYDVPNLRADDYLRNAQSQLDPHACAAVLVELGFSSNPTDASHLLNPSVQSSLAGAIICGIDHARFVLGK